jgi:hypothetical protein
MSKQIKLKRSKRLIAAKPPAATSYENLASEKLTASINNDQY